MGAAVREARARRPAAARPGIWAGNKYDGPPRRVGGDVESGAGGIGVYDLKPREFT
jgi:hypothetical protein